MANQKIKNLLIQLLKEGQQARVPAYGISMYPLLRPGDQLLVEPTKPEIGDIAVFDRGDVLVAHRVYKIRQDNYFLKGDSLIHADTPVHINHILGVVIARYRKNKCMAHNNISFRLFKLIIPRCTFTLGRPLYYYARLHQKLIAKRKH